MQEWLRVGAIPLGVTTLLILAPTTDRQTHVAVVLVAFLSNHFHIIGGLFEHLGNQQTN